MLRRTNLFQVDQAVVFKRLRLCRVRVHAIVVRNMKPLHDLGTFLLDSICSSFAARSGTRGQRSRSCVTMVLLSGPLNARLSLAE